MNLIDNQKEKDLNQKIKKNFLKSFFKKKGTKKANSFQEIKPEEMTLDQIKEKKQENQNQKFGFQKQDIQEESSIDISLMPRETIIIPRLVRSRSLLLFAFLVIIITIFILIWLYSNWYFENIKEQVRVTQREMTLVEAQSRPYFKIRDEIANLEKQAARTEKILNEHVYWTKFFSLLEKYTLAEIYFGDFKADTKGEVKLNAVGKNLLSIAQQMVTFSEAKDFVKEIKVSEVGQTPTGIKAVFTLVLADGVFKK